MVVDVDLSESWKEQAEDIQSIAYTSDSSNMQSKQSYV